MLIKMKCFKKICSFTYFIFFSCVIILPPNYASGTEAINQCYQAYSSHEYGKAIIHCAKQADEGDGRAATLMALMYKYGNSGEKNPIKQFKYIKMAESLGDNTSSYLFDLYCAEMNGGKDDIQYSCKKLRENAYKEGNAVSQNILATILLRGTPLGENTAEATRLLNIGADKKYSPSMLILGSLSLNKKNPSQEEYMTAYIWFKLAEKYKDNTNIPGMPPLLSKGIVGYVRKMVDEHKTQMKKAESHLSANELHKAEALLKIWPAVYNKDDYQQAIAKHILLYSYCTGTFKDSEKNRMYPVELWIDRNGKLLSYKVYDPSGKKGPPIADIDKTFALAIDNIFSLATPFPAPPDDYEAGENKLKFEIEMNFVNNYK